MKMMGRLMLIACLAIMLAVSCVPPPAPAPPKAPAAPHNLARNGDFSAQLTGWSADNAWYADKATGKGVSAWAGDEQVFHSGPRSAKVVGAGNRGILLQAFKMPPGQFHVEGWIKTEKLDAGCAKILVEFMDKDGKWICGTPVGNVSGTADWTHVSGPVTAPKNAHTCHLDLLTTTPNQGTAWFDDIVMQYAPPDNLPPRPVPFQVNAKPANGGAVSVTWQPVDDAAGICRYDIYVEKDRFASIAQLSPKVSVDWTVTEAMVDGLQDGARYWVAVVPVDLNRQIPPALAPEAAVVKDTMPPNPPAFRVEEVLSSDGAVAVTWSASPLDRDADRCCVQLSDGEVKAWDARAMRTFPISEKSAIIRGMGTGREAVVAVGAMDKAGNLSAPVCTRVKIPAVRTAPAACATVSGTVSDAQGRPIAGAEVWAEAPSAPRVACKTDPAGRFILKDLPEVVCLCARATGCAQSRRVLVSPLKQEVQVAMTLQPSSSVPFEFWVASSLENVFKDTPTPAGAAHAIDLLCGSNDTECAQIVLRPRQKTGPVSVEFGPLVGPKNAMLPPETGTASFVGYIHVDKNSTATPKEELLRPAPADFPDPFLEDRSVALAAGENQPIFISYFVPKGAAPGVYEGSVRVLYDSGQVDVPVKIEVMPFMLPDTSPLFVTNWFNPGIIAKFQKVEMWTEAFWAVLREYARDMRRHHQTVVIVPLDAVRIYQEDDGGLTYDFERFDRWVRLFEEEGVAQRIEILHLGSRATSEWECPTFVLHPRPVTVRATGAGTTIPAERFAAAVQEHVEKKGWLGKATLHIADEPIPKNVASWCEISKIVHDAAPKLKRIDAIHVPYESVKGHLEIPVPQLNYFDKWYDGYRAAQQSGEVELWFYIAWVPQGKYTNRLIDTACIKTRLIHWINFVYGATGYLHWGLAYWTDPELKGMGYAPGDNWIIYPGTCGPRSSLRWEAQRDGLEDYMYFHLLAERCAELKKRGREAPADAMQIARRVMRAFTDYDKSPALLEAARREAARAIVEAEARLK